MVISYFSATFIHLLLADGWQGSPWQLQSAHNGLKALKGQRRAVVVHLQYPETSSTYNRRGKKTVYVTVLKVLKVVTFCSNVQM